MVTALRRDSVDAYPYVAPNPYAKTIPTTQAGEPIYPLGGIGNVTTVHCNESGVYTIYESDRYGFHNPNQVWDEAQVDIVAVGDSFTQGACVQPEENYVSRIRDIFPKTLNLGVSGNGPLSVLATVKEYAAAYQPRTVLWFYYEGNDPGDLMAELTNPVLVQYVADGFGQGLATRQSDVEEVRRKEIEHALLGITDAERGKRLDALRLYNVRRLLRLTRVPAPLNGIADVQANAAPNQAESQNQVAQMVHEFTPADAYFNDDPNTSLATLTPEAIRLTPEQIAVHDITVYDPMMDLGLDRFDLVLRTMQQTVAGWGGELVIVYLPTHPRFVHNAPAAATAYYRPQVLSIIENAGIRLIDLYPIFATQPEPLALYPYGLYGHYSAAGNALVAAEVLAFLAGRE